MTDRISAPVLGVDHLNANHETPEFPLGHRITSNEKEFVYCKAGTGGWAAQGYACVIDEAYLGTMAVLATGALGDLVGIAQNDVTADYYGWLQVKGVSPVRVAASAAANTVLNVTSTAGQLDDDNESGGEDVNGLVLTAANGGSAGNVDAILNYPELGATN